MNVAADFADMIGESEGSQYRSKADEILEATKDHYGKFGDYIYECDVRPQDGAVIHSIATFGKFLNFKYVDMHCCRLQTVYSPITVKNFVTMYTAFNLCN